MTTKQKLQIEQSENREKLNGLLGKKTLDDKERGELDELSKRLQEIEPELRAAIVAEAEEESRAAGLFGNGNGDGEAGERGRLLRETRLSDYMVAASGGNGIEGRARELNSAFKIPNVGPSGGVLIPWAMLERRAYTTTANNDGGIQQRPILQRIFGPGVMDQMGVQIDAVPVGRSEWTLVSGGVAPVQKIEGAAAADAVALTFETATLKPKRLTAVYELSHELMASVAGVEEAARRDLVDAISSKMSDLILNGAASGAGAAAANVEGLITELGAGTDLSAAEATAGDYGKLHSLGVDGIHATAESEVRSIVGDETYQHAAGLYIAGSGFSGSQLLRERSGGCMASSYIPAKASKKQSAIIHAAGSNGGAMRGDAVAAIWPGLELIRDPYSNASQGVKLTALTLWDAAIMRAAAFKRINIQISA